MKILIKRPIFYTLVTAGMLYGWAARCDHIPKMTASDWPSLASLLTDPDLRFYLHFDHLNALPYAGPRQLSEYLNTLQDIAKSDELEELLRSAASVVGNSSALQEWLSALDVDPSLALECTSDSGYLPQTDCGEGRCRWYLGDRLSLPVQTPSSDDWTLTLPVASFASAADLACLAWRFQSIYVSYCVTEFSWRYHARTNPVMWGYPILPSVSGEWAQHCLGSVDAKYYLNAAGRRLFPAEDQRAVEHEMRSAAAVFGEVMGPAEASGKLTIADVHVIRRWMRGQHLDMSVLVQIVPTSFMNENLIVLEAGFQTDIAQWHYERDLESSDVQRAGLVLILNTEVPDGTNILYAGLCVGWLYLFDAQLPHYQKAAFGTGDWPSIPLFPSGEDNPVAGADSTDQGGAGGDDFQLSGNDVDAEPNGLPAGVSGGELDEAITTEKLATAITVEKLGTAITVEKLDQAITGEKLGTAITTEKLDKAITTEKLATAITAEKLGTAITTEKLGDAITGEKLATAITTEKLDEAITTKKLGDAITAEKLGTAITTEKLDEAITTKKLGDAITGEKLDKAITGEKLGTAITVEKLGEAITTEKLGTAITTEKLGTAITVEKLDKAITGEKLGTAITDEKLGAAITGEKLGTAITAEKLDKAITGEKLGTAITVEKLGEAITTEKLVTAITDEKLGTAITTEKLDKAITTEKLDKAITAEKLGTAITDEKLGAAITGEKLDKAITGEKLGTAITGEKLGTAITGEKLGTAITTEKLGTAITVEKLGEAITTEKLGAAITTEKLGNAITDEKLGAAITGEKLGTAITDEKLGAAITGEKLGTAITAEKLGDAITGEKLGTAITTEKLGDAVKSALGTVEDGNSLAKGLATALAGSVTEALVKDAISEVLTRQALSDAISSAMPGTDSSVGSGLSGAGTEGSGLDPNAIASAVKTALGITDSTGTVAHDLADAIVESVVEAVGEAVTPDLVKTAMGAVGTDGTV
ncbi:MAG: hypothetical protein LBF65_03805, partial [Holosporales bacterium]|nr:hypothetical protein [Holosporales bacterium]